MTLNTESIADQNDHFACAFVRENVAYSYDLRKFTVDAINVLAVFSVRNGLELSKICKNNNHTFVSLH